ncbi:MAG: hypothetical protein ACR2QS_07165 [Woeseiaceae bacterium]
MNSSTSSSEQMQSQRRIFLKIFLTILLGMGAAMGLVRGFTEAMGANSQEILGRVLEGQEGLQRMLVEDENDLVMVYGSSMVEAAFGPRYFDQYVADIGGDVSSWNFGFGGLNPMFQEYLARRMVDDFNANDRRLKLLLIEFNPFQTTKTRRDRARVIEEPYMALLGSREEIVDRIFDDPASGLRIAEIKYLRDGASAEAVTTYFFAEPFQEPDVEIDPEVEENEAVQERIGELAETYFPKYEEEFPEFSDCDWCYDWKGGHALRSEYSAEITALLEEYYELVHDEYQMEYDRIRRILTSDVEDLHFEEDLVVAFIGMVKVLAEISDNIEIIMLPKNDDWIQNPPEALQRQKDVVARIERETGVRVRDFQKIDAVTNHMFSDTTHLNGLDGREAFTSYLAEEYGHLLVD